MHSKLNLLGVESRAEYRSRECKSTTFESEGCCVLLGKCQLLVRHLLGEQNRMTYDLVGTRKTRTSLIGPRGWAGERWEQTWSEVAGETVLIQTI